MFLNNLSQPPENRRQAQGQGFTRGKFHSSTSQADQFAVKAKLHHAKPGVFRAAVNAQNSHRKKFSIRSRQTGLPLSDGAQRFDQNMTE
jgi:hypothetical protein